MTQVEQIARYSQRIGFNEISKEAKHKLKTHILDSLGCALAAVGEVPIQSIRTEQVSSGSTGPCTLIGGGTATVDRAAFYNGALVRQLDFMDDYFSDGPICHPSDCFSSILAAAELSDSSGRDFLTSLAIAYHLQCRLSSSRLNSKKESETIDPQALAVAAGVGRILRLTRQQVAHALAIAGDVTFLPGVTYSGRMSQWSSLAAPAIGSRVVHSTLLAQQGITGPARVLEGKLNSWEIRNRRTDVSWLQEQAEGVLACSTKSYSADSHSQSCLEGILELRSAHSLTGAFVKSVDIELFTAGYDVVGGGAYGRRDTVVTREDAFVSLPYLAAVALLDGEVEPGQFTSKRIARQDVQSLLSVVSVRPSRVLTRRYASGLPCRIRIVLHDGKEFVREKQDYAGFYTRPMAWDRAVAKFERVAGTTVSQGRLRRLEAAVAGLEYIKIRDLTKILGEAAV